MTELARPLISEVYGKLLETVGVDVELEHIVKIPF